MLRKVILDIVDQMLHISAQPPSLAKARFDFLDFLKSKMLWFYAIKIALAVTTNMNICFHLITPV